MSWLKRLKSGLSKTSSSVTTGITDIVTKRKLDDDALEELEELLIQTDMGAKTAAEVVAKFSKTRFEKEVDPQEVKTALASEIATLLEPVATPLEVADHQPHIILVVGVNGNGKTTTIGKLAKQYHDEGKTVMLAACDTFRAAAVEQLNEWGTRVGCEVITGPAQSDPASVAFQACEKATQDGADVLLLDTAGRLQNKTGLMEELAKIVRVIQKVNPDAPHDTLLVLDATTGQNAHSQVDAFKEIADVSGLIVTKLDGTAKGGVVVALAERSKLPIHAVGVGESIEDLKPFTAQDYAEGLMGL